MSYKLTKDFRGFATMDYINAWSLWADTNTYSKGHFKYGIYFVSYYIS